MAEYCATPSYVKQQQILGTNAVCPPTPADPPLLARRTLHADFYDGAPTCGTFEQLSEVRPQLREHSRACHSNSNPGFAHQLSHKLSATFGNPTIVHRPNLRTRPSIISMYEGGATTNTVFEQVNSLQDSTAPSSLHYSGSASVGGYSTNKTSFDSNIASRRSTLQHEAIDRPGEASSVPANGNRDKSLAPIQEAPMILPTIVTVETAANAKIFFETHYDPVLAGNVSARSLRRRDLEVRLKAHAVPEEQQHFERCTLSHVESAHLRQMRRLKGKQRGSNPGAGVAVAGYEVVRVLGKGSFGVVRLVRELQQAPDSLECSRVQPASQSSDKSSSALGHHSSVTSNPAKASKPSSSRPKEAHSQDSNQKVCAMKVIRKSDMLRNCQEGHLRAERDFLVASEKSRWVVPLIASFQDQTNLYLVMEYMIGGDFLGLLFRRNILKERHARWYVAEIILCVEETHRRKWIHRDIKPDNFLIAASGHLRISDFGLAFDGHWSHDQRFYKNHRKTLMEKLGIEAIGDEQDQGDEAKKSPRSNLANILTGRSRASHENAQVDGPCEDETILQWRNREGKRRMAASVVGTSQYMAPEVIRGDLYDGRCDWWSIGIILYEVGIPFMLSVPLDQPAHLD